MDAIENYNSGRQPPFSGRPAIQANNAASEGAALNLSPRAVPRYTGFANPETLISHYFSDLILSIKILSDFH